MVLQSIKNENIEGALAVWGVEHGYGDYHSECRKLWKAKRDPDDERLFKKNAIDVALTGLRLEELLAWLETEPRLKRYYEVYLTRCIRLAAELKVNGIYIHPDIFKELSKDYQKGRAVRRVKLRHTKIKRLMGVEERDKDLINANGDWFIRYALYGKDEVPEHSIPTHEFLRGVMDSPCRVIKTNFGVIPGRLDGECH